MSPFEGDYINEAGLSASFEHTSSDSVLHPGRKYTLPSMLPDTALEGLLKEVRVTPVEMHLNLPGNLALYLVKNILTSFFLLGHGWSATRKLKEAGSPFWICQRM